MTGQLLTEDDQRTNKSINYISLNGSLVLKRTATIGTTTWANTYEHTDALHSPTYETNNAGNLTRSERYTPYGEPSDGSYQQGPGFTGHVTDAATGLTYAQQRYYDPVMGRFLTSDPVPADDKGGSYSRYWYANGNPYKFLDPDGRVIAPTGGGSWCDRLADLSMDYAYGSNAAGSDALANHVQEAGDFILAVETAGLPEFGPAIGLESRLSATAAQITKFSVTRKLEGYLLNPLHPVGGAKAAWFSKALGFTRSNMMALANQIKFDAAKAVQTGATKYGTKYNQTIAIKGANGKTIDVVFAWMKSKEDDVVRLVTAIPAKK